MLKTDLRIKAVFLALTAKEILKAKTRPRISAEL